MRSSIRSHAPAAALAAAVLSLLVAAAGSAAEPKFNFAIPRTTREQALQAISQQTDICIGYHSRDDQQGKQLVAAIKGRFTLQAAMEMVLRSSTLHIRQVRPDMVLVVDAEPANPQPKQEDQPVATTEAPSAPEGITVTWWPVRDLDSQPMPVEIIDRERIDAIGAQSVADVLRQVTQNGYARAEGYYASGAQYAEIRGLGPETALILINGRRALPSANSIASNAFDLNSIPISAIERIEILPNAAAAWHGADGIAGTVNIVTRQHIDAPSVEIGYGGAAGGAGLRNVTLAFGKDGDRFNSAFVFDYLDRGGLLGAQRSRWNDQDYRRYGGKDLRSPVSPIGNISSIGSANLPGLSSPIAAVPLTDATPGIAVEDFIPTAGTTNRESLLRYESIVPESKRVSFLGTGSYSVTPHISATADLLIANRNATFFLPPAMLPGTVVPASNAFNPFGTSVLVTRLLVEEGKQYQYVESDLVRVVAALHGSWTNWRWELSALHSQEQAQVWIQNELDPGAVMQALASSDPSTALNVFQSGPVASPSLLAQLIAPRSIDEFGSSGDQLVGYLEGRLWSLPAGFLTAKVGGEWRRESSLFDSDQVRRFNLDRDITSAFIQVRIPVLKDLPAADELWLTADRRLDRYEGMAQTTNSQFGLQWQPHPTLIVRASQSQTFRPPSLYEFHLPQLVTPTRVVDPAREEAVLVPVTTGGNPWLRAANGESWTTGFEFRPVTAMNWYVSADYWRVAANQLSSTLPPATVLAHENAFPDRVTRAEPTEAGTVGRLLAVDSSRINATSLEASGVDLLVGADIQTGMGRFTPELRATWFDDFRAADIPGEPRVDRVNVKSDYGSILKWRAIASLQWRRGPYGLATAAHYSPAYSDAFAGEPTGGKIPSQMLFDLHGSLDIERALGAKSLVSGRLTAGAINLFDAEPGFSRAGSAFDFSQGDLKGRWFYLRFEKEF